MSERDFLVTGLGNIGSEYESTRHNIGFMVLDAWAQASNAVFNPERYGDMLEISIKGRRFHLLKPNTYMNLSGNAVRYWLQKLDIPVSNLIVICDDLNLPFGRIRMRERGSDGGHNGLKNIIETIETQDFARIRIGIGHEFSQGAQVDYVLGRLSEEEIGTVSVAAGKIREGIQNWAFCSPGMAMNILNQKENK